MEGNAIEKFDSMLWIGPYVEGEYLDYLKKQNIFTQYAANRVQKYYLTELSERSKQPIDVLSALVTSQFPKTKNFCMGFQYAELEYAKINNVPYINAPIINILSQSVSLKRAARTWVRKNNNIRPLVIIYALRIPFLKAAQVIKKIIPGTCIINIVPDLPLFTRPGHSSPAQKVNNRIIKDLIRNVDGFVLYADAMAEALEIPENRYIVNEGIIDETIVNRGDIQNRPIRDHQVYAYLGGLSEEYGTKNLVEGFLAADLKDTELHLYGNGNYTDTIVSISKKCPNVKYCGSVSPDEAFDIMCGVDLLINPRPAGQEFTKYSCPSKIMEYMASGTPVLMTRLEGIPEDYFNYTFSIDDASSEGIKNALQFCSSMPTESRAELGKKAQDFIISNKSSEKQVSRILHLAQNVVNHRGKNNT